MGQHPVAGKQHGTLSGQSPDFGQHLRQGLRPVGQEGGGTVVQGGVYLARPGVLHRADQAKRKASAPRHRFQRADLDAGLLGGVGHGLDRRHPNTHAGKGARPGHGAEVIRVLYIQTGAEIGFLRHRHDGFAVGHFVLDDRLIDDRPVQPEGNPRRRAGSIKGKDQHDKSFREQKE